VPVVGVLALQGDFAEHLKILDELGLEGREVRRLSDMEGLDGLVLPGGESTAIALGLAREGLDQAIVEFAVSGSPILGTCAGMVLLGRERLGVLDAKIERNAFGRQVKSFETDLSVDKIEGPDLRAIFIRAPAAAEVGSSVEVLAELDGRAVALRQDAIVAIAFHPELVSETRLHQLAFSSLTD
jgi:5'-phosphate synthase pdxT subunit